MSSGSFRRCGEFLRNFRVLINCGMPLQKGGGPWCGVSLRDEKNSDKGRCKVEAARCVSPSHGSIQ